MKTVFITNTDSTVLNSAEIETYIKDEGFDVLPTSSSKKPSGAAYAGVIILSTFDNTIFDRTREALCRRLTNSGGSLERIIVCCNKIGTSYQNAFRTKWKINKVIEPATWDEEAIAQRILAALYGGFGIGSVDDEKKLTLPDLKEEDLFLRCPIPYRATEKKIFNFIGPSLKMRRLFSEIKTNYSLSDEPILITGDTGTGKEFVATAIHTPDGEIERMANFFDINIAEFTKELLSSELFGYIPGAFTGAGNKITKGMLEVAGNGTVFFDEIGDLPVDVQIKLLRVINNRHFRKVGEHAKKTAFNGRLIFATHRDLKGMCDEGNFREDFYYRITGELIEIPPLLKRKGDLELLAKEFYQVWKKEEEERQQKRKNQQKIIDLDQEIFDRIVNECISHDFPGNVRRYRAMLRTCFNESLIRQKFNFVKLKNEIFRDKNPLEIVDNLLRFSVAFDPRKCNYNEFIEKVSKAYFTQVRLFADSIKEVENISGRTRVTFYKYLSKEELSLIKSGRNKMK